MLMLVAGSGVAFAVTDADVVDTIDRCSFVCGRAATFDIAVLAIAGGGVVVPVACLCRRRDISRFCLLLLYTSLMTPSVLFESSMRRILHLGNQSDHVPACCMVQYPCLVAAVAIRSGLDVRGSRKETAELHKLCLSDNIDFRMEWALEPPIRL